MITIKDMAQLAGVSPTTVTNVLHGRTKKMSKETLEKVQEVIESSNYVSNMGARMLANYGSKIIGVIMHFDYRTDINIIQDPFYAELIGALERRIREMGYYMMFYTSGSVKESLQLARSWNVEGLIINGSTPEAWEGIREELNVPIVFVDSYSNKSDLKYYNVGLDDFEGGYIMTKHLIRLGHKRIAFFATNEVAVDAERQKGYKEALKENHLTFSPNDYIELYYNKSNRHTQLWEFCQERLSQYTALFFASDFLANDAINSFALMGVKVPRDISVVGFDNNIFSELCRPKLTTVQQSVSDKGFKAVELLVKAIRKEECEKKDIRLPIKLVIRESVRRIEK